VLSVLGRVERRLGEHEYSLLRVTTQIVEDAPMPEFLHHVPIFNYSSLDGIDYSLCSIEIPGIFADGEIEGLSDFFIAHGPGSLGTLVSGISDEGRYVEGGLSIACISHFSVAGSVVDDCNLAIEAHSKIL